MIGDCAVLDERSRRKGKNVSEAGDELRMRRGEGQILYCLPGSLILAYH